MSSKTASSAIAADATFPTSAAATKSTRAKAADAHVSVDALSLFILAPVFLLLLLYASSTPARPAHEPTKEGAINVEATSGKQLENEPAPKKKARRYGKQDEREELVAMQAAVDV
uniref:Uncharacterized protein n=1 Tax=Prymnesium polylepis TaxID=72548 RepID=A0A7S4MKG0_9EUKA